MNIETNDLTRIIDVSIEVEEETSIQTILNKFHQIAQHNYEECGYLNEITAFYNGDGQVSVSLLLVEFGGEVVDSSGEIFTDELYIMDDLPYGIELSVLEYFDGKFGENIYW